jgi:glycine dehydrogenase subunit 2
MNASNGHLKRYHAAVWDEPIVMELGGAGRRGFVPPAIEPEVRALAGAPRELVPAAIRRERPPALPELSEYEVQRHNLHLAQETLGMMGISLFGTCTMKYNPRVNEMIAARPQLAELHPLQPPETLQGVLAIIHEFGLSLSELTGMAGFSFQPGGGADAAYTHACVTRAYHAGRGELAQRDQIITTIQSHPSSAATAAAAGFEVVTLMLGDDGYPPLEALRAAVSGRTAALMVVNPDDMGVYNPHIAEWVQIVHDAGGLCFHDQANFNGTMGQIRTGELGFDACMVMLHKTFGAPKGSGGPAVGAYGCSEALVPFLPRPLVIKEGDAYRLEDSDPLSVGRIREFWGNVPQIVKAYSWTVAMGADGIQEASRLSVLANNYIDHRLTSIRGLVKSHDRLDVPRMEMTRWSLGLLTEETGVTVHDVSNRMTDFGLDAPWLSHEPWLVPEPLTPEAGELWSKEDIDYWVDVLAHICNEAYTDAQLVKSAPHQQVVAQPDVSHIDDPAYRATTWRAHLRKRAERAEQNDQQSEPACITPTPVAGAEPYRR